jgi:FKBP-type peptidyl-prolyl cis-trans isomerase
MNLQPGIRLLEEREGSGPAAEKGCQVTYNLRAYLNKGDEVPINRRDPAVPWSKEMITSDDKGELINFVCTIGKRESFAAVEYSLIGMKVGGYRKVKAKPHLGYREAGVPGVVPKNAMLTLEIWLRKLRCGD